MREAGPTRNRKREEGREGHAAQTPGDHRKSSPARKRKGEAEVLGRDTHTKTTPGGGEGKRRPASRPEEDPQRSRKYTNDPFLFLYNFNLHPSVLLSVVYEKSKLFAQLISR